MGNNLIADDTWTRSNIKIIYKISCQWRIANPQKTKLNAILN